MTTADMKKCYTIVLLFLAGCSSTQENASHKALVDLVESTTIIRTLLCQNKLGELLEEHNPEQLDILINNFSPASMAFESEVLSTTVPLVCLYFYKNAPHEQAFIKDLDLLAVEYNNRVKFVVVDAEKLFSLAQAVGIESFPALVWVRHREIFEHIQENITVAAIREKISELQRIQDEA